MNKKIRIHDYEMLLKADDKALLSCRWLTAKNPELLEKDNNENQADTNENISRAIEQIMEFLEGKRTEFSVRIRPEGTEFRMKVWEQLRRIPYGETITYAELARRIGRPKACRAVANACGANPLPIIIPCHRVVASGGRPGGYTGPSGIKQALLAIEKQKALQLRLIDK